MTRLALLLALVTACVSPPAFVGIGDHADAGAADAPPATGTATVYAKKRDGSDQPMPGVHVVFADQQGGITFEGDTDGTGLASGPVVAGGNLFAAYELPQQLVVITDIAPDETYLVGVPRDSMTTQSTGTMTIPRQASQTYYSVSSRCGGGAKADTVSAPVSVTIGWLDSCTGNEPVGVMALAGTSATTPTLAKYIAATAGAAAITVANPLKGAKTVGVTVLDSLDLTMPATATLSVVDHGYLFGGVSGSIAPNATTAVPDPGFFETNGTDPVQLTLGMTTAGGNGTQVLLQRVSQDTLSIGVDVGPSARAPFLSAVQAHASQTEPVTWSVTTGASAQLAVLDVELVRTPKPVEIRYVFEPGSVTRFIRPEIPASVGQFAVFIPNEGEAVSSTLRVWSVGTASAYSALRIRADLLAYARGVNQLLELPGITQGFVSTSQ